MIEREFVSIIMPTYNEEKFISESIVSVINQTWNNWELIIIDDCSTDHTSSIVLNFQNIDSRINYIKTVENSGVANARNIGVQQAKNKWIAFLDSDDCWHPKKLELQMEFAQKYHSQFIFTASAYMDESGRLIPYQLEVPSIITFRELLEQNIISCSSVLIEKKLLIPFPIHMRNIHEDFVVWLQILKEKGVIAFGLNMPLLIYRIHSASKSANKIRAAAMTYRVYRYIGLDIFSTIFYLFSYMTKSLNKYCNLFIQVKI